ncbi:FAD-dependent oxidoreductase [Aquamicrobium sp. LC103]|uniref:FAD-dependent oxidoreductase n=1 Tax=Aquamicrobium sp. LC103 TaxID=1120658 RepID=UPI00063ECD39|nr:FAD-dependent oxidoreductase [Aquamicrobium sp. LC103]TKT76191.1 FAD-dependent oxidoreductase [Aquamicrobium sp. LC103]
MNRAGTVLANLPDGAQYDVAVLGAGAAGMAAAIFAALHGARVILIERTQYLGGSSAYSAATTWIPNTHHSAAIGADDSFEKASTFLDRAVGNRSPKSLRDAFLRAGPDAIRLIEDRAKVKFRPRPFHPDYLYELEGATSFGRALEPYPFEGRELGEDFELIRPPIPEFTILGGLMVDRDDIAHLLKMTSSLKSAAYSARLIGRYLLDRLRHPRGTRLVMGNALIGRMLQAARELGIEIAVDARVREFVEDDGKVAGLIVEQKDVTRRIAVSGGVVLASGGFSRHPRLREEYLPKPVPDHSPSAPGHTGELHDLALKLGAHHGEGAYQNCFWAPCSVRRRPDGSTAVFPHFVFDRSKPGTVSVGRDGRRFVNESTSYHLFVSAMFATNEDGSTIPAYLITDSEGLRKYGLGMVRPGGRGLKPFLEDGYLTQASTLGELAPKLGIDADGLKATVASMNEYAKTGVDPEFGRGTTVYEKANGDPTHGPNPTLGTIGTAPFYAVRLYPGDIGSAMGLVTDENARVLRGDGTVIEGLYAVGNDMHSIMGGVYPGPGITIGPGITFGYIAGKHAAERGVE